MIGALSSQFSGAEARELTEEIKGDYGALQLKIATAWRGRIWLALDYESWQDYLDAEFRDVSLRPPKELEDQVINELRAAGMSTRGIASATEISKSTIDRRISGATVPNGTVASPGAADTGASGVPNGTPDRTVGLDGKSYAISAPRPRREPEIVDVEIVDEPTQVGGDRLAADLGIDPIPVDMSAGRSPIGRDQVNKLINEIHAGGSAPLPMVKKRSRSLEAVFTSGFVDEAALDFERLEDLGRDVADAIGVLTDLLEAMAESDAVADALDTRDTLGSIEKSLTNLETTAELLGLTEGAPAGGDAR